MIEKAKIQSNIDLIKNLYQNSKTSDEGVLYSKLAILEICGWIEESMDDIVSSCATNNLKVSDNLKSFKETMRRNYSFDYNQNLRGMLIEIIGLINVERLEQGLINKGLINQTRFEKMKSSLAWLKKRRDDLAHTFVKDTTTSIDAPSTTCEHFKNVNLGLEDIEDGICNMRF
jgi:hypothetical protein